MEGWNQGLFDGLALSAFIQLSYNHQVLKRFHQRKLEGVEGSILFILGSSCLLPKFVGQCCKILDLSIFISIHCNVNV